MDIALDDGSAFKLDGWKYISESFPEHTVHFIGLLSDGGVHSRYDQLLGFVKGAAEHGAKRIRVHILTVRASDPFLTDRPPDLPTTGENAAGQTSGAGVLGWKQASTMYVRA